MFGPYATTPSLRITTFLPSTRLLQSHRVPRRDQHLSPFPLLRRPNISFYVYSSLASGSFMKFSQDTVAGWDGRWDTSTHVGKWHQEIYSGKSTKLFEGLQALEVISVEFEIPDTDQNFAGWCSVLIRARSWEIRLC